MFDISVDEYRIKCSEYFISYSVDKLEVEVVGCSMEHWRDFYFSIFDKYKKSCFTMLDEARKDFILKYCHYDNGELILDDVEAHKEYLKNTKPYTHIFNSVFDECVNNNPTVMKKKLEVLDFNAKVQRESFMRVKVDGIDFVSIDSCEVMYCGWESDSAAWVVNKDGVNTLVTSDHGTMRFNTAEFLKEKIEEYEEAISNSRRLIGLIENV